VQFSPCLYEPLLGLLQFAADAFDGVDGVNPHLILVVRVKVRPVVWRARLGKHPDDDSIEPSNLGHRLSSHAHPLPSALQPWSTSNSRLLRRAITCMVPPGAITRGARGIATRSTGRRRSSINGYGFTVFVRPTPSCRRIENPLQENQAVVSLKVSGTLFLRYLFFGSLPRLRGSAERRAVQRRGRRRDGRPILLVSSCGGSIRCNGRFDGISLVLVGCGGCRPRSGTLMIEHLPSDGFLGGFLLRAVGSTAISTGLPVQPHVLQTGRS
jgi:hypothetical protein